MNHIRQSSSLAVHHGCGFSLVEILVALVLSLLLIGGIIQLFLGSKQTYRFHDALSRVQENGRLALDTMARDIRMAGFSPAGISPPANPVASSGADITVRWQDNGVETRTYSVGARPAGSSVPTCASAATSLRLDRNSGGAQELVEGVQAMQILYGICTTDADADGRNESVTTPPGYVPAAAIANWTNVCSVRIHLLLVSLEDRIVTDPQTVFFPADTATTITPTDRCLRQAFSTTVVIRNRMP